jgi:hypothetical protein
VNVSRSQYESIEAVHKFINLRHIKQRNIGTMFWSMFYISELEKKLFENMNKFNFYISRKIFRTYFFSIFGYSTKYNYTSPYIFL